MNREGDDVPTTEEVRHAYWSHTEYERMVSGLPPADTATQKGFDTWLEKLIRDVQEDSLAPVKRILEMTDEEVGDYNEWGSAQREFLLTELLFPHRED